jgi:hypothetical protein
LIFSFAFTQDSQKRPHLDHVKLSAQP